MPWWSTRSTSPDFEGSSLVHDLNQPLAPDVHATYTAVIDAGTLEHVFNVTEGLRSAMSLVRGRGHLVMMTPCNNNPGHGFYQLTPEFFSGRSQLRTVSPVIRCLLREDRGRWYNVADPALSAAEGNSGRVGPRISSSSPSGST